MNTSLVRSAMFDMLTELGRMKDLARRLALALADEVAFHGDENSAEASLLVLSDAREQLDLSVEFDAIDSLRRRNESSTGEKDSGTSA